MIIVLVALAASALLGLATGLVFRVWANVIVAPLGTQEKDRPKAVSLTSDFQCDRGARKALFLSVSARALRGLFLPSGLHREAFANRDSALR